MRVPEMFSDHGVFIFLYALMKILIYSFHNDDMKSSKRHVILLSLIFLLKSLRKCLKTVHKRDEKNIDFIQ